MDELYFFLRNKERSLVGFGAVVFRVWKPAQVSSQDLIMQLDLDAEFEFVTIVTYLLLQSVVTACCILHGVWHMLHGSWCNKCF